MKPALLALAAVCAFGVAVRMVSLRTDFVRSGYERARLERQLREERERIRCLEADIVAASMPSRLLETAARLGVVLAERAPDQIVVSPPPEFARAPERLLVNR